MHNGANKCPYLHSLPLVSSIIPHSLKPDRKSRISPEFAHVFKERLGGNDAGTTRRRAERHAHGSTSERKKKFVNSKYFKHLLIINIKISCLRWKKNPKLQD